MSIIERIYVLFDKTGKKNIHLAEHLGVSNGQISTWKRRGSDIPAQYIIPIAKFFGVSVMHLLTGEEKEPPKKQIRKLAASLGVFEIDLFSQEEPLLCANGLSELKSYSEKKLTIATGKESVVMDSEREQFINAAEPLMDYMRRHSNPHAKAIVTQAGAELMHGYIGMTVDFDSGTLEGEES